MAIVLDIATYLLGCTTGAGAILLIGALRRHHYNEAHEQATRKLLVAELAEELVRRGLA
jgi:hypothetical protein